MKRIDLLALLILSLLCIGFFWKTITSEKLPIPADTIVGLYHPYRDFFAPEYPNGIPFKNSLATDPVRQQYPWRELAVSSLNSFKLPLWNPYSFSGTPLLANFQSAVFYPLNTVLIILPFSIGWSILVMLQPLLSAIFMFLYLRHMRLATLGSFLGGIVYGFCGFGIAWLEWNTVIQTTLWLPLILLSIEKIFSHNFGNSRHLLWGVIFVFSLISSFFAGHLQSFFYLFIVTALYFFARWFQGGMQKKPIVLFLIFNSLFLVLTSIQWIPTLQFIFESGRSLDQADWRIEGWFVPWQHLIQFIVPDFFGNPTTLNYSGVWNYGEFIGYVGMLPLLLAVYAIFFRRDRKTFFFGVLVFISLLFALPTGISELPYLLNIPFISTSQPTRLIFVTDFALSILAALGMDYFIRNRKFFYIPLFIALTIVIILWGVVFFWNEYLGISDEFAAVAKNNLVLPSAILGIVAIGFGSLLIKNSKKVLIGVLFVFIVLTIFDLFRFAYKFTPFTSSKYLYPQSKILSFLHQNAGNDRFLATDDRIFPPNFSIMYKLQSVSGYDPLYIGRYGEFIAALERDAPDISPPFGFNRIITPKRFNSPLVDFLGVKYILSLEDIKDDKLKFVMQEGETRLYQNLDSIPRVFIAQEVINASSKQEAINLVMEHSGQLGVVSIVEGRVVVSEGSGTAEIVSYNDNEIIVQIDMEDDGFLVLTDVYYPTWRAEIVSSGLDLPIYITDFTFRGVEIPKGKNKIRFYNTMF